MFRLQYYLTGKEEYLEKMLDRVNEYDIEKSVNKNIPQNISLFLNDEQLRKEKCVLYGAGAGGKFTEDPLRRKNIAVECFCDRDPNKQGSEIEGCRVISPEEFFCDYRDRPVVISAASYCWEIFSILLSNGIDRKRIFGCLSSELQYFGADFMRPLKDEIYVDAGAYDGNTVRDFVDFCSGDYKRVYALEPDPQNFLKTRQSVEDLHNIKLVQKGAWSCKTELFFDNTANGSSHITENASMRIETISIDELVGDDKVTLIKMDIEGAELEALKGAEKTIRNNKPRLAICIYHKPEDVLEIPLLISSFRPDYRFYIRQHFLLPVRISGVLECSDTVLYAV